MCAGFFNASTEGVRAHWEIQGPVKNDRWVIEKFTTDPEISKMQVYFSDLFNGNEVLSKHFNILNCICCYKPPFLFYKI